MKRSIFLTLAAPAYAQFGKIFDGIANRSSPGQSKSASGIREALQIGIDHAVEVTGTTDGYFKNALIKILLPEKIRSGERALRIVGLGPKIDEFELSMNRAAEQSAPAAKSIFKAAILKMTFDDARKLITGGNTSATDFFKEKTSADLNAAFTPIVTASMAETGVVRQYKRLTGSIPTLPFMKTESFDIDRYVVGKALDGLFLMIGEEEKRIRRNPAAQITPLLREVFGKR